jgi:hypothetical protein
MVITLEQAREINERFTLGHADDSIMYAASLMREHGPRLGICEKNIGKRVYSFNTIQAQFLPELLRPPTNCMENLWKGGDTT